MPMRLRMRRLQPVLEKITQQTFRASEIVNGLLNFSRMGSVDFGRVDVNGMVRDTVLLLEHQMRSGGVAIATELSEDLPVVVRKSRQAAAGAGEPGAECEGRAAGTRQRKHPYFHRAYVQGSGDSRGG